MNEVNSNEKEIAIDFESAIQQLEKIANELGNENISLDAALKLYEEGVKLVRVCSDKLSAAERKIKLLQTDSDGVIIEKDFNL